MGRKADGRTDGRTKAIIISTNVLLKKHGDQQNRSVKNMIYAYYLRDVVGTLKILTHFAGKLLNLQMRL